MKNQTSSGAKDFAMTVAVGTDYIDIWAGLDPVTLTWGWRLTERDFTESSNGQPSFFAALERVIRLAIDHIENREGLWDLRVHALAEALATQRELAKSDNPKCDEVT